MKNRILRNWLLGVVSLGLAILPVQAVTTYISGEIAFTGGAYLNGPVDTATAFTEFFGPGGSGSGVPVSAIGTTGHYQGIPVGTEASFNPFAFNVQPVGPLQLWTFTVGPTTYSFDITSVMIQFQGFGFLAIKGEGVAHITGFEPTPSTWSIGGTGGGAAVFTFGSIATVPEPSTSAFVIAGFGLMAFNAIRRRKP